MNFYSEDCVVDEVISDKDLQCINTLLDTKSEIERTAPTSEKHFIVLSDCQCHCDEVHRCNENTGNDGDVIILVSSEGYHTRFPNSDTMPLDM